MLSDQEKRLNLAGGVVAKNLSDFMRHLGEKPRCGRRARREYRIRKKSIDMEHVAEKLAESLAVFVLVKEGAWEREMR